MLYFSAIYNSLIFAFISFIEQDVLIPAVALQSVFSSYSKHICKLTVCLTAEVGISKATLRLIMHYDNLSQLKKLFSCVFT